MAMKKALICIICSILFVCMATVVSAQESYDMFNTGGDAGKLTARFLSITTDTGLKSGDAIILTSPDGRVMLIDAGYDDCGDQIVEALRSMGVTRIDYLVASHFHGDHVGGFVTVIRSFEVGQLITSYLEYPNERVLAIMDEIELHGIHYTRMSIGDEFSLGEEVRVEVLWPEKDMPVVTDFSTNSDAFVNDRSLLLKTTYGKSTMLFGGDLYVGGEWKVVSQYGEYLDCDILKANHHGDRTSSSKPFLNAVSPQITVMTADQLEDVNTYKRFIKMESKVYVTHYHGNVWISTEGDGQYQVMTDFDWNPEF